MGRLLSALNSLADRGLIDLSPQDPSVQTIPVRGQVEENPSSATTPDTPEPTPSDSTSDINPPDTGEAREQTVAAGPDPVERVDVTQTNETSERESEGSDPALQQLKDAQDTDALETDGSSDADDGASPDHDDMSEFVADGNVEVRETTQVDPVVVQSDSGASNFAPIVVDAIAPEHTGESAQVQVANYEPRFSSSPSAMNELRAQLGIITDSEIAQRQADVTDDLQEPDASFEQPETIEETKPSEPEAHAEADASERIESPSVSETDPGAEQDNTSTADANTKADASNNAFVDSASVEVALAENDGTATEVETQVEPESVEHIESRGTVDESAERSDEHEPSDEHDPVLSLVEQVLGISPNVRIEDDEDVAALQAEFDDMPEMENSQSENNNPYNPVVETLDIIPAEASKNDEGETRNESAEAIEASQDIASTSLQNDTPHEVAEQDTPMHDMTAMDSIEDSSIADQSIDDFPGDSQEAMAYLAGTEETHESHEVFSSDNIAASGEQPCEGVVEGEHEEQPHAEDQSFEEEQPLAEVPPDGHGQESTAATIDTYPEEIEDEAEFEAERQSALQSELQPVQVQPTDYEIQLADRLLNADFGLQIQQLHEEIASQLIGDGPHVVMLVSMEPDPQRSEIVSGIAMYICAQLPKPTLLVDGDFENKRISRGFDEHAEGLFEVLGGHATWDEKVISTSCEQLGMIPAGTELPSGMFELTQEQSSRIETITNEWRQQYSLVLIDGGMAHSPLSRTFTAAADATFICVQLGRSNRDGLVQTTELLVQAGGQVKGCITTNPV